MATVETEIVEAQQFIGGEWVPSSGGETFDDIDPFTGDVVARIPSGTREDAKKAIEAAAAAAEEWGATPPAVKQQVFLKAAEVLESRQDEVVSLLARESGATFGFGMFQMHFVPGALPPGGRERPTRRWARSSRRTPARSRWASAGRSAWSARSRPGTRR